MSEAFEELAADNNPQSSIDWRAVSGDLRRALERRNAEITRLRDELAAERNVILKRFKSRLDCRLNDWLCEMKPGYDDSIVGFNEARDVVRKCFDESGPDGGYVPADENPLSKDRPEGKGE
jgi:hypothetical protein